MIIRYPKDKDGNEIGFRTPESYVYDSDGVNLTDKITQLNSNIANHTHNYAGSSSAGGAANSAVKLATARTVTTNLASTTAASFDGSANITPGVTGTLPIANGGTGTTTANAAANAFINALETGSSIPTDDDYYVSQYVRGGTTTTTYHRRPVSALWSYIQGKISSVLGLTASSYNGNAATATKATQDSEGNTITNQYVRINPYKKIVNNTKDEKYYLLFRITLVQGYGDSQFEFTITDRTQPSIRYNLVVEGHAAGNYIGGMATKLFYMYSYDTNGSQHLYCYKYYADDSGYCTHIDVYIRVIQWGESHIHVKRVSSRGIYIDWGVFTEVDSLPTANGTSCIELAATEGRVLGAYLAENDKYGNPIATTYATKSELEQLADQITYLQEQINDLTS